MKVVILAGGFGTRLSEETAIVPKPLVEIGGKPILWHIMKLYSAAGFNEFIVCCGYKANAIKQYFANYVTQNRDLEVNLGTGVINFIGDEIEEWNVKLIDTGLHTMTGGRLKRIKEYVAGETFCMTYGDGVADINPMEIVEFHKKHKKLATITATPSPGRFGILNLNDQNLVEKFHEKPDREMGWINGGFFVLDSHVLDYIDRDDTIWEKEPLEKLADDGELVAFEHTKFWQPMDSLRDKRELEKLWESGESPWRRG